MKTQKSSGRTESETRWMRNFVLVFSLCFLILNSSLFAQQPTGTDTRSLNSPQQPVRTYRIPDNLFQIQLVTVPQLVGKNYNQDDIVTLLDRVGLQLGQAVAVADNEKVGLIISQTPGFRQRVRPQTSIDITYGIEVQPTTPGLPENVIVPDYIGMNIEVALGRLANDRLTRGSSDEVPADKPPGEVVEQFPPPGSTVDPNTSVTFKFSSEPQQVISIDVPRLIGLSLQEAAEVLKRNQLFAGLLTAEVSDQTEGEVLNQSPVEGTAVPVGSAVDITYSSRTREELISVPNVIGMYLDGARNILDKSGLFVEEVYFQKSDAKNGIIIEQKPQSGEKVRKGTSVVLIIGKHNSPPSWLIWGGGIVAALLLGGYLGWKSGKGKQQRKSTEKKGPDLKLVLKPDTGKQTIYSGETGHPIRGIQLKIIPDKGIQTLKNN